LKYKISVENETLKSQQYQSKITVIDSQVYRTEVLKFRGYWRGVLWWSLQSQTSRN